MAENKKIRKTPRRKRSAEELAKTRFDADLIERGEAVELDSEGKLPQNATHAIIQSPEGITIKRGRLKYV